MRIRGYAVLLLVLTTTPWGCPLLPPKEKKEKKEKKGGDSGVEFKKLSWMKDTSKPSMPESIDTEKEALAGQPQEKEVVYDPTQDPANLAGIDLMKKRSPTDPSDRKKKPFSIKELYLLKSINGLSFSPDGSKILFSVGRYHLEKGKSNTEIYLMSSDGTGLRRMTRNEAMDSSPLWMPDGASFVFISTRDNGPQLWRMAADGGEPEKLTDFATGVSTFRIAPDGKKIAFVSRVFPKLGADNERSKKALEARKKSPFKAHVADDLLFRHWTFYKDERRSHILLFDIETRKVIDLTPGDFDSPAFSLGGGPGFAFSSDSKEICFVSNRETKSARAFTTNKDLWVVPVENMTGVGASGKPRGPVNLTRDNRAFDGDPAYSPDGRYIAFLTQKTPGYEADRFRLALHDRRTGKVRVLTEKLDNWVMDFKWSSTGKIIYLKVASRGRYPLFRLDLEKGEMKKTGIVSAHEIAISSKGQVAFTFSSVGMPVEIYSLNAGGDGISRLTGFNSKVAEEHDIRPAEEITVKGADGKPVHVFLVKPHGFVEGKRYPLILNVHGGPQMQWQDSLRGDWQVYPASGYVVAFFNPHGSIGYGQAYTDAIAKDWGGKVYKDIMEVADHLEELDFVDRKRVGAMGWSYGGYMMAWLLGHTDRFKAIAATMALYDLPAFYGSTEELWFPEWDLGGTPWDNPSSYRKWSPSSYAKRFRTPTLIITGEKDYRVPYTQSLMLFTALRRQNVPARLVVFPDDGHWPSWVRSMPLYYAAHLDWFHRYLKGSPSPLDPVEMIKGRAFEKKEKARQPRRPSP